MELGKEVFNLQFVINSLEICERQTGVKSKGINVSQEQYNILLEEINDILTQEQSPPKEGLYILGIPVYVLDK